MQLQDITTQFVGNGTNGNYGLMNRRDLFSNTTLTTTFINNAIQRIQRELRCPMNEKWVQVTITSPYNGLVIPNDYLELIGIFPVSDWNRRTKPDKLERVMNYAMFTDGAPVYHARQGGVWILGPAPAVGQTITLGYYSEFTPLVAPTDENILSIVAWDLIVYGALSEACAYYNDKRRGTAVGPEGKIIDGFEGKYNQILQSLNDMGADDELDEGRVQPAYYYPEDGTDNLEIWVP